MSKSKKRVKNNLFYIIGLFLLIILLIFSYKKLTSNTQNPESILAITQENYPHVFFDPSEIRFSSIVPLDSWQEFSNEDVSLHYPSDWKVATFQLEDSEHVGFCPEASCQDYHFIYYKTNKSVEEIFNKDATCENCKPPGRAITIQPAIVNFEPALIWWRKTFNENEEQFYQRMSPNLYQPIRVETTGYAKLVLQKEDQAYIFYLNPNDETQKQMLQTIEFK